MPERVRVLNPLWWRMHSNVQRISSLHLGSFRVWKRKDLSKCIVDENASSRYHHLTTNLNPPSTKCSRVVTVVIEYHSCLSIKELIKPIIFADQRKPGFNETIFLPTGSGLPGRGKMCKD